jgi:lactoylglutathione lyase
MRSRVDYVVLYVEDLSASIDFYRDVVGMELKFEENGYAEFVTEQTKFGLYEKARLKSLIGREGGPKGPTVANVFLVSDVDAEAKRLESLGISILAGPEDRLWGHRTVHIFDPDENIVEFAQEIPRSTPRHSGE